MDQDALERRYDGPIPPADPALADMPPAGGRALLFDRLAAEARDQVARRRLKRDLDGSERAVAALACYRAHGVAWCATVTTADQHPASPFPNVHH